jgi:hypothetical protein
MPQLSTNPPPKGFSTRIDYLKSFTSEKGIINARNKGMINEDETLVAMLLFVDRMNSRPMDTYGKVMDQNGQPIVGANVNGYVKVGIGDFEEHATKTDGQGLFHLLNLHGERLGISVQKNGYEFGYKIPFQRPKYYLPEPTNPLIITMWKLKGAEPMKHVQIYFIVPCDGAMQRFDLLVSKSNGTIPDVRPSAGDLMVTLTRDPLVVDRSKPFNWSVTIAITNGGLVEFTNQPYPYEAPKTGYQSVVTIDFPTNKPDWQNETKRGYYFKSNDGQVYGRMMLDIQADRPQPPTYFTADIYANPAGSRNLE